MVARVFCDRQKCDPQFVRLSGPHFVRPMQNALFVQPIHKMGHLSDLPFVRPEIGPNRKLTDLKFFSSFLMSKKTSKVGWLFLVKSD